MLSQDEHKTAPPWWTTKQPHEKSTPLARFRDRPSNYTPDDALASALSVYQGRADVSSHFCSNPVAFSIASDDSCVAMMGAGGWKIEEPFLSMTFPNEDRKEMDTRRSQEIGLAYLAHRLSIDAQRQLVFIGDEDRVKSYSYADPEMRNGGWGTTLHPVHTLDCGNFDGPIMARPKDGRLIRAGLKEIAVWNVDDLETHGTDGKKIIGKRRPVIHNHRTIDDLNAIERSSGNKHSATIPLPMPLTTWQDHPSNSAQVIASAEPRKSRGKFNLMSLDLEHEGKVVNKFLGNMGDVVQISTNAGGDPNQFVTACYDGYARVYDVRHPLPVVTYQVDFAGPCSAAVLAHPDGVPCKVNQCNDLSMQTH